MGLYSSLTSASMLGIRLVLWAGDVVPLPLSAQALDAVEQVEVTSSDDEGDGFQITFRVSKTAVHATRRPQVNGS